MNMAARPIWAGRDLRLDPNRLPQAVTYACESGDTTLTLTPRGVAVQKSDPGNPGPFATLLPLKAYRGIAARGIEDEDGHPTVTLELLHDDESLSVPLLVAHDLDHVARDWSDWASLLGVPMLLIEGDGIARTLDESLARIEGEQVRAPRMPSRQTGCFGAHHRNGLGVRLWMDGRSVIADNDR